MDHSEFSWIADDEVKFFAQSWTHPNKSKAVVAIVHGLGEHSSRYSHLASYLNGHEYSVAAFDLRGHGKSGGPRGHTPSYETLMDDIERFLTEVGALIPDTPIFLYGHSLGGNLGLNYALRRKPTLQGSIISGPWLRLSAEPGKAQVTLARIMNKIRPAFAQSNALDIKGLSRDPEVVREYEQDPLVHDRISVRLFLEVYQAGLWALEQAADFPIPLLLMHGEADRLTSAEASREFAAKIKEGCTLKIWEGMFHEIHNEPEKEDVYQEIVS
ncbi:MAG: lysophospholipase, partial [Deltaproteobacteria bacterium]|nr:lysophospholipase [Deltaproteobacteria bacterium]